MIKRTIIMAVAMGVGLALAVPAGAEQKLEDIQICTGGKDGNYSKVGHMLQAQIRQIAPNTRAQVVYTQGSRQNLQLLTHERGNKSGWCDVALSQNDAVRNFFSEHAEAKGQIMRMQPLYPEKVHFLFNREAAKKYGIDRVPNIRGKKEITISVGTAGSGDIETWKSMIAADKDYDKVAKVFERKEEALERLAAGEDIQGMVFTSGLNTPFVQKVMKSYSKEVVLLGFDDSDLKSAVDEKGKPIYRLTEIPAGMYRAIQPSGFSCMGSCTVNTVEVEAVLLYSKEFKEWNPDGYSALVDAKNDLKASILKINDPK